jgi:hypothetical protein
MREQRKPHEFPKDSEGLPMFPGHPDDWPDEQWEYYLAESRKLRGN